ncbi:EthD family reductase [Halobacterium litoreum]|uniref:EthD family reductase n=1 Tax=Halobacterium litoreum TaxID=2039234 RepID=A0ABD5NIS5_9EURY|nr:EthD family reductase [Halobacterium litoreum]UHH12258.1 EthD family reductase [Halobacterium litoreum]
MVKMVQLLVKRDDYTHEEFVQRWRGEHAAMAKDLPNLRKYVTAVPNDPERSSHDGVVELYFEDMGALAEAFDSEIGEAVQADAAEFADMDAGETLYVEEQVEFEA